MQFSGDKTKKAKENQIQADLAALEQASIILKNRMLDAMCNPSDQPLTSQRVSTTNLELITYRSIYGKNYSSREIKSNLINQYSKSENTMTINMPIDEMIYQV